ncbi:MAG TPA: hypothetical protein VGK67_36700 [Myxococcales bacterium]|jgi:hypothetical protein
MPPVDKKPKSAPAPAPEPEEEEQEFPESAQATVLGMSLEDLASSTAKGLTPPGGEDDEGEIDPSLDGQATMMLDRAPPPPPPPKRPSMKLKRPSKALPVPAVDPGATAPSTAPFSAQEEPEEEEAVDPNATMMLGADSLAPEETAKAPKPVTAGAFTRQHAKEAKEKELETRRPSKPSTAAIADPSATANVSAPAKGKWVVPAVAFALIAVVVLIAGAMTRERLPVEQLKALYPYGFEGARGPYGQLAPGADEVTYTFAGAVDCSSHAECLRFRFEGGNFSGTMIVGKEEDGTWSRATDDGLPFPATAPKQP